MISTTHITTGAALGLVIGNVIPNPAVSIPVSFAIGVISHHLLDKVPHTDPGSYRTDPDDKSAAKPKELLFAVPDNIIGTLLVLWIFFAQAEPSWPMLFGAAGGNMPDVWHNVGFWSDYTRHKILPKYFVLHETNHWTARGNLIPLGIITNVVFIFISVVFLLTSI